MNDRIDIINNEFFKSKKELFYSAKWLGWYFSHNHYSLMTPYMDEVPINNLYLEVFKHFEK